MWWEFEDNGFWVQAKVYWSGSIFGINNGRISKLRIMKNEIILLNYDRGWYIKPDIHDAELMELYRYVLNIFGTPITKKEFSIGIINV